MSNFITLPVRNRERNIAEQNEPATRKKYQGALVLVALIALVVMISGFVKPLLMAGLFAATLYPFHLKLRRKIESNDIRAGLLASGFAILFLLPVAAVAFLAASAGLKKVKDLPEDWTNQIPIDPLLSKLEGILPFDRAEIMKHLQQAATSLGKVALAMLQNLVADLPKLMVVNLVILIGIFVFLQKAPAILNWLRRLSPFSDADTDRLFKRVGGLSKSSVLATIAAGFVQATIIGVVLLIMQIPGALLITMTAFVLSFLPIIGTAPVSLYLVAMAAIEGNWSHVLIFAIMAGVVGVSDNIVRPFVLSDSAKLNGFVAFIAAVGALETMGFYGLFLGPVVVGTVFKLVELVQEHRTA